MKYALRKYIDWGSDHQDEYMPGWHYLESMSGGYVTRWDARISKAITFNTKAAAKSFKVKHSGVLGEHNSEHVEVFEIDEMAYFIAVLQGK